MIVVTLSYQNVEIWFRSYLKNSQLQLLPVSQNYRKRDPSLWDHFPCLVHLSFQLDSDFTLDRREKGEVNTDVSGADSFKFRFSGELNELRIVRIVFNQSSLDLDFTKVNLILLDWEHYAVAK